MLSTLQRTSRSWSGLRGPMGSGPMSIRAGKRTLDTTETPPGYFGFEGAFYPDDVVSTVIGWKEAVAIGGLYRAGYRLRRSDRLYR